jgi:hypothetical protein
MHIFSPRLSSTLVAMLAIGVMSSSAVQAQALPDNANMKILAARSFALLMNKDHFNNILKSAGAPLSPEEVMDQYNAKQNCGSIEIANQVESKGVSNDITVIIVGDIFNVGNRCGVL